MWFSKSKYKELDNRIKVIEFRQTVKPAASVNRKIGDWKITDVRDTTPQGI